MTTLKILWKEKEDMRRVQVAAVRQTLTSLDGRAAANGDELNFRDLRDYVLLIFPEIKNLLLYYMDDDDEQVRITNDAELDEAFRLMRELAAAAGKSAANAVCKIIVVAEPLQPSASVAMDASNNSVVNLLPGDAEEMLASQQKKKMSDLFVDLGKVVEKWDASGEQKTLKKDLVSLLHEPGCQEALMEIMANAKFATLFQTVTEEYQKNGNYLECLVAVAGTGDLEEVAKILLAKCPNARVQVDPGSAAVDVEERAPSPWSPRRPRPRARDPPLLCTTTLTALQLCLAEQRKRVSPHPYQVRENARDMMSERDSDFYVNVTRDGCRDNLEDVEERQQQDDAEGYTSVLYPSAVEVMSPTSSSSNGSSAEFYPTTSASHQKHGIRSSDTVAAGAPTSATATETDSDLEESRSDPDKDKDKETVIRAMSAAEEKGGGGEERDDVDAVVTDDEECKGLGGAADTAEEKDQDPFNLAISLDFETDTNAAMSIGPPSVTRQTSSSFSDLGDYDDFSFSDAITIPNGGGAGSVESGSNGGTPTTFYPIYENEAFRFTHASVSNCGYGSYDAIDKIPAAYANSPARSARSGNSPTMLRLDNYGYNGGRITPTFQLTQPADESQPLVGDTYPVSGEVVRLRVDNCAYIIFYKIDDSGEEQNSKHEILAMSSSSEDDVDASDWSEEGSGRAPPPRSYTSLGAAGHKVQTDNCFTRDYNHPTRSLGRGLFRASTSVGSAFLKGAAGLVNKTYQGGANGGVVGFAKGLGMGMLGLGTHTVKGAFRGVGQVTHLVGEMVLGTAPHFSIDGTLVLTNYRIIWQALSTKDAMEIPVASILSAESSTTAPHVANIEGKHLLRASLAFQDEATCSDFLSCIWELYATGSAPPHYLFAHLHYQALRHKENVKTVDGTGLETPSDAFYDAEEDYRRLKLLDEDSWMRLYDNSDYTMFPSYPEAFVIPSVLDEDDLRELSAYRSASRIPAVVWRHPHTGALVCRCAQPCTGLSGYVVEADQKMVSALQHATSAYGDAKFHFFDARSQMAAAANSAQGKGTEDPRNYPNSELHFCDIANIHAVRSSYASLASVCQPGQERESSGWLFQLRNTFWFLHLSSILSTSQEICRYLSQGDSVMIHCSDGWDRTPQLTGMVQLLLDPYYRTIHGLLSIIEKEWCSFGHMFRFRFGVGEGPGQQELEEQSPIFIQWLDALWQIWRQQPWAFEFNEALLSALYEAIFTGLYGNFLYNNERQRKQEEADAPTRSLWFVLLEQMDRYLNVEYDSAKNFNSIGLVLPFSSEENDMVMWGNHLVYADPVCRKYE